MTLQRSLVAVTLAALLSLPTSALAQPSHPSIMQHRAATAARARRCVGAVVSDVRLRRSSATAGVLSWTPPRGLGGVSFRVIANGRVVGQTSRTAMRVRFVPGQRALFSVRILSGASFIGCPARLSYLETVTAPGPVSEVRVADVSPASATLSWQRMSTAVAYRVYRDGAVVGETEKLEMTVDLGGNRSSYQLSVAAVNARGRTGPRGTPLTVDTAHRAPTTPTGLAVEAATDTSVTLIWGQSAAYGASLSGYRVIENGAVLKQTSRLEITVPVASLRSYQFSVEAADSWGYVSTPSNTVQIRTTHGAPSSPANLQVLDSTPSSLTVGWAAAQASSGRITGYEVYKDGAMVGSFTGTQATLTNLAPTTSYEISVVAVDSFGRSSVPAGPLSATTGVPVPSTGRAYAFLLESSASTDSFADLQRNYMGIGTLYPTYYECNESTGLSSGTNDTLITTWAQARHILVLPRFDCQDTATLNLILTNPSLETQVIAQMVSDVTQNGYDGLNLDWEAGAATDRDLFTAFVTQLATALHSAGKLLDVDVSPKTADVANNPRSTFFNYPALAQVADRIFVMAWGIHWTTSAPGSPDDITWQQQVVNYVATMAEPTKFVIGLELYGMDWVNGGGAANGSLTTAYQWADVQDLIAEDSLTPALDAAADSMYLHWADAAGNTHDLYYEDAATEAVRLSMIQADGFGVGFWRLGSEDPAIWANPLLTNPANWPGD
jgi:spore germination protein YaaH